MPRLLAITMLFSSVALAEMQIAMELTEHIRRLEARLLKPEVRSSPEELTLLLAEDVFEIGSSGRTFDKKQIIATLQGESELDYSLQDFQVKQLSSDIALATYRIAARRFQDGKARTSLRSSIWVHRQGRWQLMFHQGTPTS